VLTISLLDDKKVMILKQEGKVDWKTVPTLAYFYKPFLEDVFISAPIASPSFRFLPVN